jgi:hypothetical protein
MRSRQGDRKKERTKERKKEGKEGRNCGEEERNGARKAKFME